MKALLIADAKPQESLLELVKGCDIVILLGDLFYEWIEELKDVDIPKVGVTGNHDYDLHMNQDQSDMLKKIGAVNLHLNTFEYKGVRFSGFTGEMGYIYAENHAPYYKGGDMDAMRNELSKLESLEPCDVFITHFPSVDTHDMPHVLGHKGIKAFRDYIDRVKPKHHFHGHMHKPMSSMIDATEITCVFPYAIKEF